MLPIHLMQNRYRLSDVAMEDALEVEAMGRFAGIDLTQGRIADATTILAFRHFLEKHHPGEKIRCCRGALERASSTAEGGHRCGCHHDSCSLLHPELEELKRSGEIWRDLEMHQTGKGNHWFFGMKPIWAWRKTQA